MWPYSWTHVGTPSHLGHMDRVVATMPSQAHAGAAQEAPNIGQWEGQDVPLVRPSSCIVKGGIPSSRRYLPTYLKPTARTTGVVHVVRVPFHASMPIPWTALITPIRSKFKKAIPDLQVRVTLKPSPNLRLLFHLRRMRALRRED